MARMQSKSRRPPWLPALLVAAASAGLLWGGTLFLRLGQQAIVGRFAAQIQGLGDDEAAVQLGRLSAAEPTQRAILVATLDAPRGSLAEITRQELLRQTGQWFARADSPACQNLAALAEQLAATAPGFRLAGQKRAAALAAALLLYRGPGSTADQARLVAACQRLIRLGEAADQAEQSALAASSQPPLSPPAFDAATAGGPLRPDANIAGGGLPVDVFSTPLPSSTQPELASQNPEAPPQLLPTASMIAASAHPVVRRSLTDRLPSATVASPERLSERRSLVDSGIRRMSLAEARSRQVSRDAEPPPSRLAGVDGLELLHRVREGSDADAAEARDELVRRGFGDLHFQVAEELLAPEPQRRRQLVRMLPGLAGIDAAPWLLWLCRDEDADVRLAALALIVTTATPELLAAAEPLARADADPRVQQQGEIIGRLRRARANSAQ